MKFTHWRLVTFLIIIKKRTTLPSHGSINNCSESWGSIRSFKWNGKVERKCLVRKGLIKHSSRGRLSCFLLYKDCRSVLNFIFIAYHEYFPLCLSCQIWIVSPFLSLLSENGMNVGGGGVMKAKTGKCNIATQTLEEKLQQTS